MIKLNMINIQYIMTDSSTQTDFPFDNIIKQPIYDKSNKDKIDMIFNKITNNLSKNGSYWRQPYLLIDSDKYKYHTVIDGINMYYFATDDIEIPNTYYYHYFSYEFDDIVEEYKKTTNKIKIDQYDISTLFHKHKNNLSDLSWILTRYYV